jgi:hypothetical protein
MKPDEEERARAVCGTRIFRHRCPRLWCSSEPPSAVIDDVILRAGQVGQAEKEKLHAWVSHTVDGDQAYA